MKKLSISLLIFCLAVKAIASGHVATAVGVSPTCHGSNNGSATAAASGGIGPYGYTWTGPAGYTGAGAVISGLFTGTYIVTATDSSDMSIALYTLNLTEPSSLIATASGGTTCAGSAITLNAVGSGGTPGYSYLWSPGTGLSNAAIQNPVATPVVTTTYTVMVTDANGCTTATSATIMVTPAPTVTTSVFPGCGGSCNGSVSVAPVGGGTYNWSGPGISVPSSFVGGLCPGTYTVTVTAGGCSATSITTLWAPPPVMAMPGTVTPANCGACDGSAAVIGAGGTAPYTYVWSPGGGSPTTGVATGLCAGVYMVAVTDAMGCTSTTTSIVIPNGSSLTGALSSTPSGCGACNGSANVTVSGGTGSITYDWSPGTPAGDGTPSVSGLCVGTYSVLVTDATGCSYTGTVNIVNTTPIVVTATSTGSGCGSCNGTVTLFESGGTGPYAYDLNNGSPAQPGGNFTGICAGTYTTSVTDASGCTGLYTVTVPSISTATFTVTDYIQPESGTGVANGFIDLTVTGSTGPYTFAWSNGATTEDIYSLTTGTYTVTITDSNGDCSLHTYVITTTPTFGYITGYLYSDDNTNCTFDAGDEGMGGYFVNASDGTNTYYGYTNYLGYYTIYVPVGNYTITPASATDLSSCFSAYSLTVTNGALLENNNFCYNIPPTYDVCASLWSTGIVPGFNGTYNLSLHNNGNQPLSGVAYMVLPSAVSFVSATPAPSSVSGDTVFWNYGPMPTYAVVPFVVMFNTPVSIPLGTPLTAFGNATVTNGTETNFFCNSTIFTRNVSGSFDPNVKTVSPAGTGTTGNIPLAEDEFTYMIQFQNTGNGPAVNIHVEDTLSSLLDPLSFQMIDASHLYTVELMPGNVIRWQFDSIMLADSTTDEAASHGHVQFRVHKLSAPSYGEVIENTASIYFDFNEPVVTNTAVNTYALTTGIDELAGSANVSVYPNPFSESTTFVITSGNGNESYSFEMTDVLGKTVRSLNNITGKQFSISRNGLQNGIYFYKIYSSTGIAGIGKVVIR